jgi:hypothetical protein
MSDRTVFAVRLYSPRWQNEDTYKIELEGKYMKIEGPGSAAICILNEEGRPTWSGGPMTGKLAAAHPLDSLFENESIYPPSVLARALQAAWVAWRKNELDDVQVQREVMALGDWLNAVSKNKPHTDFWKRVF